METRNTFPVFEPDQVLTNNHLNDLFNYLDQQNRLSRMKLIGSGIVCGLEITFDQKNGSINISKGCGLTSQGFLITFCDSVFKSFIAFNDFPVDKLSITQCSDTEAVKLFYQATDANENSITEGKIFKLLTEQDEDKLTANEKIISIGNPTIDLKNFIVVLFLRAEDVSLKNCDTKDCNDKGSEMHLGVIPLLVDKSLIDATKENPDIKKFLHPVDLKRYNVPVKDLTDAGDVLEEFSNITDVDTIHRIADNYKYCYLRYNYLLDEGANNPFDLNGKLEDKLKDCKKNILSHFPFLIQYFYDFLDDLIKAYIEFRHKVFDILGECCGNELRFPYHLMLGEATINTDQNLFSKYRQQFIYSPLFDAQNNKLNEIRSLFRRMKLMVQDCVLFNPRAIKEFLDSHEEIKITPGMYGHHFLSERCIPYYYDVRLKEKEVSNQLHRFWNYDKTRRGNEEYNLSYNAVEYAPLPFFTRVVNPLYHDIEWYNFFRVEGHIGKPISRALFEVKSKQQEFNLAFDIIALSADSLGTILKGEEPKCEIEDLESDYRVLVAEFICEMHELLCKIAAMHFKNDFTLLIAGIAGTTLNTGAAISGSGETPLSDEHNMLFNFLNIKRTLADHLTASKLVSEFLILRKYRKGDTLDRLCKPGKETVGRFYIDVVRKNNGEFDMGAVRNKFFISFFTIIDTIEGLLKILLSDSLSKISVDQFKKAYTSFADNLEHYKENLQNILTERYNFQVNEFLYLINESLATCINEKVQALKTEYLRRLEQYRLEKNFNYYFKKHQGLEHKAGVPKGGTFVLVYHEERKRFSPNFSAINTINETGGETESSSHLNISDLNKHIKDLFIRSGFTSIGLLENKIRDLVNLAGIRPPLINHITDQMVIADFYVPYMCCSDCAPVAYVIPKPDKEEPEPIRTEITLCTDVKEFKLEEKLTSSDKIENISNDGIQMKEESLRVLPSSTDTSTQSIFHISYTLNGIPKSVIITLISPDSKFNLRLETSGENKERMIMTLTPRVTNHSSFLWKGKADDTEFETDSQVIFTQTFNTFEHKIISVGYLVNAKFKKCSSSSKASVIMSEIRDELIRNGFISKDSE